MVEFTSNVTTQYWEEDQFDCEATSEGNRKMNEIARRYQGRGMREDEEYLTIQDSEEEYGLDIIGSGKTRVVINMPERWTTGETDCIAKIQWDPTYHQTDKEIWVWENANGKQAALLAPLLDWSEMSNWLMMPKAERYTGISQKEIGRMVRGLRNRLGEVGFRAQDIRRANVGRVDGRDVVIDYGQLEL